MNMILSAEIELTRSLIDPKRLATLRASFALLGHEMHVVNKADQVHFEVRRWGQCRTCSTTHDLEGFLAQLGSHY